MKTIRECTFRTDLDVKTLLVTRGAPFPVDRLGEVMICPHCRSRRVVIALTPPAQDRPMRVMIA